MKYLQRYNLSTQNTAAKQSHIKRNSYNNLNTIQMEILAQAEKDLCLKSEISSFGDEPEIRQGSIEINKLISDPESYSRVNTISSDALIRWGHLPSHGNVQLVKIAENLYEFDYVRNTLNSEYAKDFYLLGCADNNQGNAYPAYVDIPKNPSKKSFLITSTLSGGSLVVTDLDENNFRVYNDGRVYSSLLYDDVLLSIDFRQYSDSPYSEGVGSAFMFYDGDKWKLVLQKQIYIKDSNMVRAALRDGESSVSVTVLPSTHRDPTKVHDEFDVIREGAHNKLKTIATLFDVEAGNIVESFYSDGEYSRDHAAIKRWNELRAAVIKKINDDIKQLTDKRIKLQDALDGVSDKARIINQIKQLDITEEFYYVKYISPIQESAMIDSSWLWQQIKNKYGFNKVVITSDGSIKAGHDEESRTIGERYSIKESYNRGGPRKEQYMEAKKNFREINIPGVTGNTSVTELKRIYLDEELSIQERGALSGLIEEKSKAEYVTKLLNRSASLDENIKKAGVSFGILIPQDFYLSLVGDNFGGRCYPLVRAMAVALGINGAPGANELISKLYAASASPLDSNSTMLKNSLVSLHSNTEAIKASTDIGFLSISEVASQLTSSGNVSFFALNTNNHSMLVGKLDFENSVRFYFYDPNVGIYGFDAIDKLSNAMQRHLINKSLAKFYGAFGTDSKPLFKLVKIQINKMSQVPLGGGIKVGDLSRPGDLSGIVLQNNQVDMAVSSQEAINEELRIQKPLLTFEAEVWSQRLIDSTTKLANENSLEERAWVPILKAIETQSDDHFKLPLMDSEHLDEPIKWLVTNDDTFIKFRKFLDNKMSDFKSSITINDKNLTFSNTENVDALNHALLIQSLFSLFSKNRANNVVKLGVGSPNLMLALNIHFYLGLTQSIHSAAHDVAKITDLARSALRNEALFSGITLNNFSKSIGRQVNEIASILFGIGFVGLDIYELTQSKSEIDTATFSTQLAFDSAALVTSLLSSGASLYGASAVSSVLGYSAPIIAGLGIGFTALAQNFAQVTEDAKAVGKYFYGIDSAYKNKGYSYHATDDVMVPIPGAVIKGIDFRRGDIYFNTQYIYRTHHGKTGSGYINYFFWVADFPKMIVDKEQAINIREGLGYEGKYKLEHSDCKKFILPITPISYMKYEYMILPGATSRHDKGFDLIRKLEEDGRFDFDFYIFPSEEIIRKITQEYVQTQITLQLDDRDRVFIIPPIPKSMHGYLEYVILGSKGATYSIVLSEGCSVRIPVNDNPYGSISQWYIDSSQLKNQDVTISEYKVKIGGVVVDFVNNATDIYIFNDENEIKKVNFDDATIYHFDLGNHVITQLNGNVNSNINIHLDNLVNDKHNHNQYVKLKNHMIGDRKVGAAVYDTKNKIVIFTDSQLEEVNSSELGAIIGDYAYFYSIANATAWSVEIKTGKVISQYLPPFSDKAGEIVRFWSEGDNVYLARSYQRNGKEVGELVFNITESNMELMSIIGDDEQLKLLAISGGANGNGGDIIQTLLSSYQNTDIRQANPVHDMGAPVIEMIAAPIISVYGVDSDKVAHKYWIKSGSGDIIKPNLSPMRSGGSSISESSKHKSSSPIPSDLVLASIMERPNLSNILYFYSHEHHVLYRQEGFGQKILDSNKPTAFPINIDELISVVNIDSNLIAITNLGILYLVNDDGSLTYVAVTESWLKKHREWWRYISIFDNNDSPVAVMGLKARDRKTLLPSWILDRKIFVASLPQNENETDLIFISFYLEKNSIILFSPSTGHLYQQEMVDDNKLHATFPDGNVAMSSELLPSALRILPSVRIKSVDSVVMGLKLVTTDGEILFFNSHGSVQLIGLSTQWMNDNDGSELISRLTSVSRKWGAYGLLTLEGINGKQWFSVGDSKLINLSIEASFEHLNLIGINPNTKHTAYIYNKEDKRLYVQKNNQVTSYGEYENIKRLSSWLMISRKNIKSIDDVLSDVYVNSDVNYIYFCGKGSDNTFVVGQELFGRYVAIIIDCLEDPSDSYRLLLNPPSEQIKPIVYLDNGDIRMYYFNSGTTVILKGALSYTSFYIHLYKNSAAISVSELITEIKRGSLPNGGVYDLSLYH